MKMHLAALVLYAFLVSSALTLCLGFLYYVLAMSMMWVMRKIMGEDHRGYYFLNLVLFAVPATFLVVFALVVRSL